MALRRRQRFRIPMSVLGKEAVNLCSRGVRHGMHIRMRRVGLDQATEARSPGRTMTNHEMGRLWRSRRLR
jgi:hypothetical protein